MSALEFPGAGPLWLTLQLGLVTVLILLVLATPLAWWLARTHSRAKATYLNGRFCNRQPTNEAINSNQLLICQQLIAKIC
jgi:hypothetical protein